MDQKLPAERLLNWRMIGLLAELPGQLIGEK
jgi:hypothetical protein